ncbi:MAG: hypothetical protein IH614_08280 [Desulfuromonadales bacterium]|nr:hypothetical protein [Desulfuromonadales bacterium]
MNRHEAQKVREAAEVGRQKYLQHVQTHHAGKLVGWTEEEAQVDIYGKREVWSWHECKEFRPDANYRE